MFLNFEEYCHLMNTVVLVEHLHIKVRKGGLKHSVIESGKTMNVVVAQDDPRFNKKHNIVSGYKTRNVLIVPVREAGTRKVIGLVEVANKNDPVSFGGSILL